MKPYCGARIAHSLGKPIIHWFHSFHRPPDVLFKSFVVFMIVSTIFVNMATRPQNTIVEPEVRTLPTTTDCSVSYIGVHLLGVGEGGGTTERPSRKSIHALFGSQRDCAHLRIQCKQYQTF